MSRLFCIMGKSASGKDTVYHKLLEDASLGLSRVVPYTTRPMRSDERNGEDYFFVSDETFHGMEEAGKVIESRIYYTVHGPWTYFTADDGQINTDRSSILVGTLEVYAALREHFGPEYVVPLYINVEDGLRLERALGREKSLKEPRYAELCRRFLADCEDFSDEKLAAAGIERFYDNEDLGRCVSEIKKEILNILKPCVVAGGGDIIEGLFGYYRS